MVLSRLSVLVAQEGGPRRVGLREGQTWELLARRRSAWAAFLAGGPTTVGLHLSDGFEFAAALLGAWSEGVSVLLPGDASPETQSAMRSRAGRLIIGDASAPVEAPQGRPSPSRPMPELPVIVFTSGTTGDPVAAPKPLRCLDAELSALEAAFGPDLDGSAFLSTVSHQHFYGLLFKVLWPLASGRPFHAGQFRLPEEIAAAAADCSKVALVSSPALLKRIGASPESLEALAPARAKMVAVFSSGGPLPWDAVRRSRAAFGIVPSEVYGSSETGGVAWRRRDRETDPWKPLCDVEVDVAADGTLLLKSGHCVEDGWIRTDDLASRAEGGFHLQGRADRIVKIEEKRVSLAALERELCAVADVAEAKVLVLKGPRDVLGAVVRLIGNPPEGAEARRLLAAHLRKRLEAGAETVALPRRWRFVDRIPVDSMGKSTQAVLEALFAGAECLEPEVLFVERGPKGLEIDLFLPAALRWFKGHFPDQPILPGVVQLHWAILAAREHLGLPGEFRGVKALKFMRPLLPDQRVTLTLSPHPEGFDFCYTTEAGKHAGGRVQLG